MVYCFSTFCCFFLYSLTWNKQTACFLGLKISRVHFCVLLRDCLNNTRISINKSYPKNAFLERFLHCRQWPLVASILMSCCCEKVILILLLQFFNATIRQQLFHLIILIWSRITKPLDWSHQPRDIHFIKQFYLNNIQY